MPLARGAEASSLGAVYCKAIQTVNRGVTSLKIQLLRLCEIEL